MPLRIAVVLGVTLLTLLGIWWRWVWLPPSGLNLVPVNIQLPQQEHPLDELLRRYAALIGASPSLLEQLRGGSEPYRLKPLLVDGCEVNQGQFRRFVNWRAAQVSPPPVFRATPPNWEFKSQTQAHQLLGQLEVAAGGLSFHDAWAYCRAAGGRLPTAAEFEAIASGAEHRLYPWGDEFHNSAWPNIDPTLNIAQQCGAHPATDTPEGVHDLGSSLLEWVSGETGGGVLMGGNAWHRPRELHALNFIRRPAALDFRSAYTGFRCVYDEMPPITLGPDNELMVMLPWGGNGPVVRVAGGERRLGPPPESRIVPLLRAMRDENIGVLRNLPLTPATLDIQVMRHEVSRRLYARFLRDPLVRWGFFNHPMQPPYIRHQPEDWGRQQEQPEHPVTGISWWSAWAFAEWAGGALPTAEQWQALAGAGLQRFPYGNEYEQGRAVDRNYSEEGVGSASADASSDDSAHGVIGFGGNVAEWTGTSVLRGNAFNVVVKGGSYLMPADGSQVAQTSETVPDYRADDLGFRLVFPPEGSR